MEATAINKIKELEKKFLDLRRKKQVVDRAETYGSFDSKIAPKGRDLSFYLSEVDDDMRYNEKLNQLSMCTLAFYMEEKKLDDRMGVDRMKEYLGSYRNEEFKTMIMDTIIKFETREKKIVVASNVQSMLIGVGTEAPIQTSVYTPKWYKGRESDDSLTFFVLDEEFVVDMRTPQTMLDTCSGLLNAWGLLEGFSYDISEYDREIEELAIYCSEISSVDVVTGTIKIKVEPRTSGDRLDEGTYMVREMIKNFINSIKCFSFNSLDAREWFYRELVKAKNEFAMAYESFITSWRSFVEMRNRVSNEELSTVIDQQVDDVRMKEEIRIEEGQDFDATPIRILETAVRNLQVRPENEGVIAVIQSGPVVDYSPELAIFTSMEVERINEVLDEDQNAKTVIVLGDMGLIHQFLLGEMSMGLDESVVRRVSDVEIFWLATRHEGIHPQVNPLFDIENLYEIESKAAKTIVFLPNIMRVLGKESSLIAFAENVLLPLKKKMSVFEVHGRATLYRMEVIKKIDLKLMSYGFKLQLDQGFSGTGDSFVTIFRSEEQGPLVLKRLVDVYSSNLVWRERFLRLVLYMGKYGIIAKNSVFRKHVLKNSQRRIAGIRRGEIMLFRMSWMMKKWKELVIGELHPPRWTMATIRKVRSMSMGSGGEVVGTLT